ncbi:serine/threonine-protein kinase [Streptosporangium sandarakinum]|uniref:serine/threonine-protein kinase n=1 Tax=Streptosporangium sandarakinum TaxID=1260955 RepID=UPI0033A551E2
MPDVTPDLIAGRYRLVERIGRGAVAEVWRGYDHRLDVAVAVKILDPSAGGAAAAERFAREIRAAAQIVHPNTVTLLDVGQEANRRFMVMELLTGRTLAAELAARGPLPVAETCLLLAQAAAGLAAAHRAGVVHRDVKPANLHLSGDGTLKIVDFGLARIAGEAARLTTAGTIVGTAAYLAPEQIGESGGEAACDLYGLGCVAYELLCGRPPFIGSVPELVHQHVHRSPDPLGAHRPGVPAELERLIMAMLAKNPGERPAGAEQVRQVLDGIARSVHTPVRPAAPTARPAGPPVRPAFPAPPAPSSAHPAGPPVRPAPAVSPGVAHPTASVPPVPPVSSMPSASPAAPVAARAGDTTVFAAPPIPPVAPPAVRTGRSAGPRGDRRLLLQVGAALAAIVIATVGAATLFSGSSDSEGTAATVTVSAAAPVEPVREREPSATPAPTAPPTVRPAPTPTPAPTRTAAPARPAVRDPRAWLAAFDRAVTAQQERGGIDPRLARRTHHRIQEASRKLAEGKAREAGRKIQEAGRDLLKARSKGMLPDGPLTAFLGGAGLDAPRGRSSDEDDD